VSQTYGITGTIGDRGIQIEDHFRLFQRHRRINAYTSIHRATYQSIHKRKRVTGTHVTGDIVSVVSPVFVIMCECRGRSQDRPGKKYSFEQVLIFIIHIFS
jgi:ribosomal protein S6E (S10)